MLAAAAVLVVIAVAAAMGINIGSSCRPVCNA